jgi:hypothetical protein
MNFRSIEIDIDVHKRIEAERKGFAESPNDVLRRLLGLGRGEHKVSKMIASAAEHGRSWTGKGVTLPSGTKVRMVYNGQQLSGVIADGKWVVDGREFSSPSAAASKSVRTKSGKEGSLDGWKYWEAKRPGDDGWTPIGSMRPEVQRRVEEIERT